MNQPDQKKLRILMLLLIVLGVTLLIGYWMNRTPDPAVVQAEAPKPAALAPRQTDARIRLDLLKNQAPDGDLGKKNLFQYGPPPAPPAPPKPRGAQNQAPGNLNPNPGSLATNIPSGPPAPPPPPPIPLKYIGFAYLEPNSQHLIAALSDDTQHHFNAVEGDIFMGRYRVGRVTATSVDVEDLQSNRRQTLPLVKQ
jgi:hypothetical protein